jgi:hypothetical protein
MYVDVHVGTLCPGPEKGQPDEGILYHLVLLH